MSPWQQTILAGLITLAVGVITLVLNHVLTRRREGAKWQEEEVRRLADRKMTMEREYYELGKEKYELETENSNLERELQEQQREHIKLAIAIILLLNQRRDMVRGFNQKEMASRAIAMRAILSGIRESELLDIANEKKPLPEIPGRPQGDDLRPM